MGDATFTQAAELARGLNDIYNQAAVKWDATVADATLPMPEGVGESIKVDKSLLSAYSAGMRRIRSAFTGTSTYQRLGDDDIYYIFLTTLPMQGEVTTEIPSGGSEDYSSPFDGYMPYGKPFGFVRSAGLEPKKLAWVVAHELGHGAFQLQHVWLPDSRNMGGTWYKENTPNLMSYTQTPELFRWQWQDIHNPVGHSNILADVKDLGAKSQNEQVLEILESIRCLKTSNFNYVYIPSTNINSVTTVIEYGNNHRNEIFMNRDLRSFYITKSMIDKVTIQKSADSQNVFYTIKNGNQQLLFFKISIANKIDFENYYFNNLKTFSNVSSVKLMTEIIKSISNSDVKTLTKSINKSSICVIADLSLLDRCKAITLLSSSKVNAEKAECIMKIMYSFSSNNDKEALIDYFEKKPSMSKICIDTDSWIDNNLYQRFCSTLLRIYIEARGGILKECLSTKKTEELYHDDRYFIWRKNFKAAEFNPGSSNIWYRMTYEQNGIRWKQGLGSWIDAIDGDRRTYTRKTIPYLDPVVVSFETTPSFFKVNSKQIALPAFAFAWMCSEQVNGNIKDVADVLISLAGFSSAINASIKVMQIKTYFELITKSFRLYQAALNLGNATLVVHPTLKENLKKSEFGKNFLITFNTLGAVDSYSGIMTDLIIEQRVSALSTLSTLWERAKNSTEMKPSANSKEFKQMDELINNLNSVANGLSR